MDDATNEKWLREYLKYKIQPVLRRQHLLRDVINAFVGDRGSGKSISAGKIAFQDHMVAGETCWSNMKIKVIVHVTNGEVKELGLRGGDIIYEAQELDIDRLLQNDGFYHDGVIVIDEINVECAESRRTSSNVNLFFDRWGQMLRKDRSALIWTAIDEMWVDNRVRNELTDTLIRCYDTALTPGSLALKKPQGITLKWLIYPMSRKLMGLTYGELPREWGGHLPEVTIRGKDYWDAIDTWQKQAVGKTSYPRKIGGKKFVEIAETEGAPIQAGIEVTPSAIVERENQQWGWLYDKIQELADSGITKLSHDEMWEHIGPADISNVKIGMQLKKMGIKTDGMGAHANYLLPVSDLPRPKQRRRRELVGARG